ncbi:hypothetical protein ISO99_04810 [Staphylococcus sp. 18_1_E_LY]|nr:hypothetical protein [Staphylococcus lloydii]MBF7019227.1 hypothetical protein [Staphylococcus lloydii]MBF7026955.1 hypothetical protein [Staphylococcus lloydii]
MNSKFYYSDKKKLVIYVMNARFNKETVEALNTAFNDVLPKDYRVFILPEGTEVIDMDLTKED